MTKFRRLMPHLVALLPLAMCLFATPRADAQETRRPAFESVRVGWQDRVTADHWNPVRVRLTGGSVPETVSLRVTVQQSGRTTFIARRPGIVAGPTGTLPIDLVVAVPAIPNSWQVPPVRIDVDLLDENGGLLDRVRLVTDAPFDNRTRDLSLMSATEPLIAAGDSLRGLTNGDAFRRLAPVGESDADANAGGISGSVARLDPGDLSNLSPAYESLAALALPLNDLASLPNATREAIRAWVRAGGTLAIVRGSTRRPFDEWLPAPQTIAVDQGLGEGFALGPSAPDDWRIGLSDYRIDRFVTSLRDDERAWLTGPDVATGLLGSGRVILLDESPGVATNTVRAETLWRVLLGPAMIGHALSTFNGDSSVRGISMYSHSSDDLLSIPAPVSETFDRFPNVRAPSLWPLLLFIAVLGLLIGPVDRVVLKRFGRMHLSWLTASLWIILAGTLAYFVPLLVRSGESHVGLVRLFDVEPDGSSHDTAFYTLLAGETRRVVLSPTVEQNGWARPALGFVGSTLAEPFQSFQGRNAPLLPFTAPIWSPRAVRIDDADVPVPLTVDLRPHPEEPRGAIGRYRLRLEHDQPLEVLGAAVWDSTGYSQFIFNDSSVPENGVIELDVDRRAPVAPFATPRAGAPWAWTTGSRNATEMAPFFLPGLAPRTTAIEPLIDAGTHRVVLLHVQFAEGTDDLLDGARTARTHAHLRFLLPDPNRNTTENTP